jgi:epoxyqueuosine reductase
MNAVKLKRKVKELARANNLDYVGIAKAELLQNEPEGMKPTDFLPGAQAIVSLGIKLSQGVQLANKLAHQGGPRHAIYSYLWHGFGLPNLHYIDRTALLVTRLLEKEGYIAVPVMSSSPFDIRSSLTEFSNLDAAVAAGLGELGFSGLLLTPDVGPRARFGSVITTAELKPDPMYDGPTLCDLKKCQELGQGFPLCVAVCPTKAIGPDVDKVTIGHRSFEIAHFERYRCMWGSMGLSKNSLGLRDIPMPEKVEVQDVLNALNQRDPSQVLELMVINRGDYCGKCIMECPVGIPKRVEEILLKVAKR